MPRPSNSALLGLLLAAGATAAEPPRLETVVVSASRSDQAAAGAMPSIGVVSAEELALLGATHISEVLGRIPGTWISRGNGQEHLTAIRSPVFTGPGSCGAFYMAEDNVPIRPAGVCNVNELAEVNSEQAERIEVLRGPGTAVHGGNAQHGVINIISAAPPAQRAASLSLMAGPHGYLRSLGSYGDRGEGQAWRVSVNATRDGGYKDRSGFQQQKLSYRHDVDAAAFSLQSLLSLGNLDQQTASFVIGKDAYRDAARKKENPNPEAFRENVVARWSGRLRFDRGDAGTLTITPYLRYQDMRFLQHFLLGEPLEENGLKSAGWLGDWRVALGPDLELTTGIDGEWSSSYLKETQERATTSSVLPVGKHYDYDVESLNGAAFAQLEWQARPSTRIVGGARIERQAYDYDNRMLDGATRADGTPCGPPGVPLPCRYSRPADGEDNFTEASWNAGIAQDLGANHTLVLNFAHGFRPPQASELYRLQAGQVGTDIEAEGIDSIEAGLRGAFGALRYEFSYYLMHKDDVIFQDSDRRNVSGAKTRHEGIEYSFAWDIAAGLTLSAAGTLAEHTYDSNAPLQGLPVGTSIKGNAIDTAPRLMSSVQLEWAPRTDTRFELEWQHMGHHYLEPTESFDYPGHDLVYLRGRHEFSPRFALSARIDNLLDEDYAERADFAFGDYRYFVGEPRALYLEVEWKL